MMNDNLIKKIRFIQAKRIAKDSKSISFSKVVNDELQKSLK